MLDLEKNFVVVGVRDNFVSAKFLLFSELFRACRVKAKEARNVHD